MARKKESVFNLRKRLESINNTVALNQEHLKELKECARRLRARIASRERDIAMESIGLKKVRGAVTGKVYYE